LTGLAPCASGRMTNGSRHCATRSSRRTSARPLVRAALVTHDSASIPRDRAVENQSPSSTLRYTSVCITTCIMQVNKVMCPVDAPWSVGSNRSNNMFTNARTHQSPAA
jgi:hypothetical protein